MLQLKNIIKDYPAGDETVRALNGISLNFRKSEFVSILGPSGCGKTTMLNIIGGLDHYTSGDLVINGVSTKNYKDRDWDSYRNHSVGFVFQSYNLIPHQTVLSNVELALVLSGVPKSERRARAKKALEAVGLGNQLNKKQSAMSGGQIQRVAIARALVNDPDIILADEPTGALDTQTSKQVMDILKEVSKDRLVIMVTHNPDLAKEYSTRIIQILDGEITDDSMPMTDDEINEQLKECEEENKTRKKIKKPSMSLGTSFMLSLKNLFTKKGRTLLTGFAGSIGIIGIALILSVSQGATAYINQIQEETLSSYPITLEKSTIDLSTIMETFMDARSEDAEHGDDEVYGKANLLKMISAMSNLEEQENDLVSFKKYLEDELAKGDDNSKLSSALSTVQYTYDLPLLIYSENSDGTIIHCDTTELLTQIVYDYVGLDYSSITGSSDNSLVSAYSSSMSSSMSMWQEMLEGKNGEMISDLITDQYDLVYGEWPTSYDEVVVVLDDNNEISDLTLYAMGLLNEEELKSILDSDEDSESIDKSWSYSDICNQTYHLILNSSCYSYDDATGLYTDLRETDTGLKYLYNNAMTLKVSGIIKPNEDATASILTGSICYTGELTRYVIKESQNSDAIAEQISKPTIDVTTGLPFKSNSTDLTDSEKEEAFREYISALSTDEKAELYVSMMSIPSQDLIDENVDQILSQMDRATMESTMISAMEGQMSVDEDTLTEYVEAMSDDDIKAIFTETLTEQFKSQYAEQVASQLASVPAETKALLLDSKLEETSAEDFGTYYDELMTFSDSTYEDTLLNLGYVDLDDPASINLYSSSFANKDIITDSISTYNEGRDELEQITYTDYVGLMMSSITTIINAITYILIAFVGISLIVSSIMIGVITLISVQERTKEIGILRSIGASKRNVSSMFNAETLIIGFLSGLLGVGITALLCIPINLLLHVLSGINTLNAYLPLSAAIILVIISMLLTLIAGIIPSKSAAKKDPVVALRSE